MRFFISYSRQDYRCARQLYEDTCATEHVPWLDVESIPSGADWQREIDAALSEADLVLLVVSPWSLGSPHVQHECRLAEQFGKPVLMLLLQSVPVSLVPSFLSSKPWIDIRAAPQDIGKLALASLRDPSLSCLAALPVPRQGFSEIMPGSVRRTALAMVLGGSASLVILAVGALLLLPTLLQLLPSLHEWFPAIGCMLVWGLLVVSFAQLIFEGFGLMKRRHNQTLRWLATSSGNALVAGLGILLAVTGLRLAQQILWLSPTFAVLGLMWGITYLALVHSTALRLWEPAYHLRPPSSKPVSAVGTSSATHPRPPAVHSAEVRLIFAPEDRAVGRDAAAFLKRSGFQVRENRGPRSQDEVLVVIVSPESLDIPALARQWHDALSTRRPVIPVLLQDTPLPDELGRLNWIDLRSGIDQGLQDLVAALRGAPRQPRAQTYIPPRTAGARNPVPPAVEALGAWLGASVTLLLLLGIIMLGISAAVSVHILGTSHRPDDQDVFSRLAPMQNTVSPEVYERWMTQGLALVDFSDSFEGWGVDIGYLLAVAAWILEIGCISGYLRRTLNPPWIFGIQGFALAVTIFCLVVLIPTLNWLFDWRLPLNVLLVLAGAHSLIGWGWMVLIPGCRRWLFAGDTHGKGRVQSLAVSISLSVQNLGMPERLDDYFPQPLILFAFILAVITYTQMDFLYRFFGG